MTIESKHSTDFSTDWQQRQSEIVHSVQKRLQQRERLRILSAATFEGLEMMDGIYESDVDPSCGQNVNAHYSDISGQTLCAQSGATFVPCSSSGFGCVATDFVCSKSTYDCKVFRCVGSYVCQTSVGFRCSGNRFVCGEKNRFDCLSLSQYDCTNDFNCGSNNGSSKSFLCDAGQGTNSTTAAFTCGLTKAGSNTADTFSCTTTITSFSCTTAEFKCEDTTSFNCNRTAASGQLFDCTSTKFDCVDRYDCYPASSVKCNGTNSNAPYNCPNSYSNCKKDQEKSCVKDYVCLPTNACVQPTPFGCTSPTPYSPPDPDPPNA